MLLRQQAVDADCAETILLRETSAYQRVVVTRSRAGIRLFLNGKHAAKTAALVRSFRFR